ncbi:unnamed protein product, partial [Sphagnum compactum]
NLSQNPRTLLPKFFGHYSYICGLKNVRIIAMNNLLPSYLKMHQKYDLKGSTYRRKADKYERQKDSPTYKDLDFIEHHPNGLQLESEKFDALIKTIERDCRVLKNFNIMDYSLLIGIHNLDLAAMEKNNKDQPDSAEQAATEDRSVSIFCTTMESIGANVEPIDSEEDVSLGGIPALNSKGERLLLFIGIIDILQSYRLMKKLEHTWKAMFHDGDSISVHRPRFYARRFLNFMKKSVFKKIPSDKKISF